MHLLMKMSYWSNFGRERSNYFLGIIAITTFLVLIAVSKEKTPNWKVPVVKVNSPIFKANGTRPNAFCKDIFKIQNSSNMLSTNEKLNLAMEVITNVKVLKNYMFYLYYAVLSTLIPPAVQETEPFKGINGSNYTIPQRSKLDRMNWKLPYLPCRLREYKAEDFHTCVQKRNQRGKKLRISFIGDSRVRRPMEHLLELLNKYNLTITTEKGDTLTVDEFLGDKGLILWPKYKQKIDVRSSSLPSFHVSYMWAPYFSRGDSSTDKIPTYKKYLTNKLFQFYSTSVLNDSIRQTNDSIYYNETAYIADFKTNNINMTVRARLQSGRNNGAFDELKRLLQRPLNDLPDIIFIGSSAWQLTDKLLGFLRNLDFWGIHGTQTIYKTLEELGSRTTVILLLPNPFKDFLRFPEEIDYSSYVKIQNNKNQQWYLNAQLQLYPKNIHVWDTFLPIAFSQLDDCAEILKKEVQENLLPRTGRFSNTDSYMCTDRMHIGQEAISIAVQMILNQICNGVMDKNKKQRYCCDS